MPLAAIDRLENDCGHGACIKIPQEKRDPTSRRPGSAETSIELGGKLAHIIGGQKQKIFSPQTQHHCPLNARPDVRWRPRSKPDLSRPRGPLTRRRVLAPPRRHSLRPCGVADADVPTQASSRAGVDVTRSRLPQHTRILLCLGRRPLSSRTSVLNWPPPANEASREEKNNAHLSDRVGRLVD